MTLILICFASELFTLLLSLAIMLTPNSREVNELSRSDGLGLIQDSGFLLSWEYVVQKQELNRGSLIRNSSSQGKLLLMLNGDYAAELPGSAINAQETQEWGAVRESQQCVGCGHVPMQTSALQAALQHLAWSLCGVCDGDVGVGVCVRASAHQCSSVISLLRGDSIVPNSGNLFLMCLVKDEVSVQS